MNLYLDLFLTFAKVGLFTFGGGYAMLPMLQTEIVEKKKWASDDDLLDYFAVGQCTPGIIAVNTASFIGFNKKGIPGCIAATVGVIFPSVVIILLIASLLTNFAHLAVVQHALSGIRIAVCVLILKAVLRMAKTGIVDWIGIVLFVVVLALAYFEVVSTIVIIVAAALVGIMVKKAKVKKA